MLSLSHRTRRPTPVHYLDEIGRMLDRFWEGEQWPLLEGRYCPPLDVVDSDESIIVAVELPGLKPDDIELSVEGSVLTISGEKKESSEEKGDGYYHSERHYGRFHRVVKLSSEVDTDNVSTEFDSGVLTVTLPRVERSKRKRIEVKPK